MKEKSVARLEVIAWAILAFGAALRLYQLAEFPFHPDEAIHAWFAYGFRSYRYDPTYHGPLLYHLVAPLLFLLDANDFTARLVPALLGILLLWMVLWPGRRFLGERAALWSGGILAISPVVVAYSRRLLHDSLVLVLTLSAVYCFQVALEQPSTSRAGRNARIALAIVFTLFLATKANAFFIAAMLLAFWIWKKVATQPRAEYRFDWKTSLLCVMGVLVVWVSLYRQDALPALPRMIEYWGGQQSEPRLPGPNDYYLKLMLLYELPIVLFALWGAWCAASRRTPFTDLVLWWALTSLALYAIANEKVPWLLVHQILPMSLLAGYGLAQLEWKGTARKLALGFSLFIGAIFLLRHIEATNLAPAADRREPMFFAQTTEDYRESLFEALESTSSAGHLDVWIEPDLQWPAAWYLRDESPLLGESRALWNRSAPDASTLRVLISTPESWQDLQFSGKYSGWHANIVDRYVWPRPAWSALVPQRFIEFWRFREAGRDNGVLAEDSVLQCAIATRNPTD